jgi:two-component sensor histidine kinase
MDTSKTELLLLGAIGVLATSIFILDLLTPLGIAIGVLYTGLVLLSLWSSRHWLPLVVSGGVSVLTVLGFFLPSGPGLWVALPNRALCLATIWVATLLVLRYKRIEDQIKASLSEKEVLLKEIHHRVKNNLQVVDSLLRLQACGVKDPNVLGLFEESQTRVRSIALLYETLCRSRNLARIDMLEYIQKLTTQIFQSYGVSQDTIRLQLHVQPVSLTMDTAFSCGLIINELISNSLKHAFPSGSGAVSVQLLANQDQTYTLVIGDTGVGLPREVDERTCTSLGLQLVSMLLKKLDGTSEMRRSEGTTWTMTFPELVYQPRF